MYRILFVITFLVSYCSYAQRYPSAVIDYRPAPGQHINTAYWGTPEAAQSLATGDGHVSLGAFGGSVTVQFSPAVQNHPLHEYGIDFVIWGNAQPLWCEGGAVQVMCDSNRNGRPDETWYQLASSQHFFASSRMSSYTYSNPFSASFPVTWAAADGREGTVANVGGKTNDFYPQNSLFPSIAADGAVYEGWEYEPKLRSANGSVQSFCPAFGIADCRTVNRYAPLTAPDNPYTPELEGCGGDSFDISWAVDSEGNYVHLDSVHFVRVYNAFQGMGGWLGELSPEITSIFALSPKDDPAPAANLLVADWIPETICTGTDVQIDAAFFRSGQYVSSATYRATASDAAVLSVDDHLRVRALRQGTASITIICNESPQDTLTMSIRVQEPSEIAIDIAEHIYTGDTVLLSAKILDTEGQMLDFLQVHFSIDASAGQLWTDSKGKTWFAAEEVGIYELIAEAEEAGISRSLRIKVEESSISPRISLSFFVGDAQVRASQMFDFATYDLAEYVTGAYSAPPSISLASALAYPFGNVSFESDLRFTNTQQGISLNSVPISASGGVQYYHASQASSWLIIADNQCYVSGLDTIDLHENMRISAVLASGNIDFTSVDICEETSATVRVAVNTNTVAFDGSTCSVTRTPIIGATIASGGRQSVSGSDGTAVFSIDAGLSQTFTYNNILATTAPLGTAVRQILTESDANPLDWTLYRSVELYSIDGRLLYDGAADNGFPVTIDLPHCYFIHAVLRDGHPLVEHICN